VGSMAMAVAWDPGRGEGAGREEEDGCKLHGDGRLGLDKRAKATTASAGGVQLGHATLVRAAARRT
jgi:hypothetical protein